MREPNWSKRELTTLKSLYESGVPRQTISIELNRSPGAVGGRAQIKGYRRPKRSGAREIAALQKQAVACGLDEAHIPGSPATLKIVVCLANFDITAKHDLDVLCSMGPSARNQAIQILKTCDLVLVDEFSRPSEIILTRRAYRLRPEPSFGDPVSVRDGVLPTMKQLTEDLESWTAASCRNPASVDRYRAFVIRQLIHAGSGDITPAAFHSIFFDLSKINADTQAANDPD